MDDDTLFDLDPIDIPAEKKLEILRARRLRQAEQNSTKSKLSKMFNDWLEGKLLPAIFAIMTASLAGGVAYVLHLINR